MMELAQKLKELSKNLYWAWHPECVKIFRDIDPELWRQVNHNPVEFLERLAEDVIDRRSKDSEMLKRLDEAFDNLQQYLGASEVWGAWYAGPLRAHPVAYLSAEFAVHESLPIYSGGLGVLAGDHLKAASDLGIPMVGVGLAYTHGYFDQSLDASGWQQEHYFSSSEHILPVETGKNEFGQPIRITVNIETYQIWVGIWQVRVGRNLLLLLDTNVEGNSEQDRNLTSRLYAGDRQMRIRQEIILGVGGIRALNVLGIVPSVIHMNEGHSAFASLELARALMERDGQIFDNVVEQAASMCVFTTHTVVAAGHDVFDPELVKKNLEPLQRQLGLTDKRLLSFGRINPDNEKETFSMTVLGLKMSRYRNAVSALHARITKTVWNKLFPGVGEHETPINYITNGVHIDAWLAKPMADLYNKYIGNNWREMIDVPSTWRAIEQIEDSELWEKDQYLRSRLAEYIDRTVERQERARGPKADENYIKQAKLDPNALTIGIARRFTAYKRLGLLFKDPARLDRLVNSPGRRVQFIFAGKAHPKDDEGKHIIQMVFRFCRDPRFVGKIIFIENYDFNVCRHLVQGVDAWINTPRRPLEACGTSGQKVAMNGGLNISILDGWWAEAYDGANGFAIGTGSEHSNWDRQDHLDTQSLYEVLEKQVVPLFYDRDAQGIPHGWVQRQKHSLRTLTWRFSSRRMLMDYTLGCYLPAAGGMTSSLGVDVRLLQESFTLPPFARQPWMGALNK
jgi:glycogen phosphorylase